MWAAIGIVLPVVALCPSAGFAQDASMLPEMRRDVATAPNDTVRADALARLCFHLIRANPDSARLVGEQALALANRIGHPRALGDAHNNLGWLAVELGELRRADSLLAIALGHFKRIGDPKLTAAPLSNLGWLADRKGDHVASLRHFHEALAMSEQANDPAGVAITLYSIGITYRKAGDMDKALDHIRRAIAMERRLGRSNTEANCLVGLANTYREMGDTTGAVAALDSASMIYARLKDHFGLGLVQENLGDLAGGRDMHRALAHYKEALDHYEVVDSRLDKAYVLCRSGIAEARLGMLEQAGAHLHEGLVLARGIGDRPLLMEYEKAFAQLARRQGDADAVYRHLERHLALKDSLQGADTQRELARLRTAFETERQEKDNAVLRAANSEQQERIRRGRVQLRGSIAIGVLALAAAALFFRNYRQKKRHAHVLQRLNERLADSNAQISEINGLLEMKLLRSQMNPHFIYNCLNSAARMTQAGKQVEALAYLQGFAGLLRMVLDHSVDDHIPVAAELDFLRRYLELEAGRIEGLQYAISADRALLDDDAEVPALVVQPFVENAIWHGLTDQERTRRITVHFAMAPGGVQCTITDNGLGRGHRTAPGPGPHRSLGMQLTSERLRLLTRRLSDQGAIRVEDLLDEAGAPAGTRVMLDLPGNGPPYARPSST